MADYYPLIARAISGLDENASGETRRALYERARTALIAQLRGVQPALTEAEITHERLALEDAVRRVEADAAKRPRPEPVRGRFDPSADRVAASNQQQQPRQRPGDALRARVRPNQPPRVEGEPTPAPPRPPRAPRPDAPPRDDALRGQSQRDARRSDSQMLDAWEQESRAKPRRGSQDSTGNTPPASRMRDFVADAEDIGRAPARRAGGMRPQDRNSDQHGNDTETYSYDESLEEAEHQSARDRGRIPAGSRDDMDIPAKRGFPVKSAVALILAGVLIAGGYVFYKKVYPSLRASMTPAEVADAPKDATGVRPKITDRVGQPGEQIAPVAQRVVLYDEDPNSAQGKQFVGTVVWRTEPVKATAGQPQDVGVRADIDIPEKKMKMTLTVRRNSDASLPASHTAELTFALPADFGATVSSVPGVLMKSNEQTRGTPLAGLAVKVTDGFFLVGLSNVEADKARNMQLLKERSWFDIPIVYSNQRRSIIAIEKGAPGERAFNEAFRSWGQ